MGPRPDHSGGSVSANAGAELAALISARGTSVCAKRSIIFGWPVAAAVVQTGVSGPANGDDASWSAFARLAMLPASSVANAVPANAETPAETSSLCARVDVAMSHSQKSDADLTRDSNALSRRSLTRNFRPFRSFCKPAKWVNAAAYCRSGSIAEARTSKPILVRGGDVGGP